MKKLVLGIAIAMLAGIASASAQPFPNRPITVVVPFAAGGVTDIVARIVTDGMKNALGQSIVVENQGGAGGTIAVTRVQRAPADGYTLVVGQWTSHVGGGAMYPLNYDILNDFQPISMVSTGPLWIIGNKDIPANNIKELVAWLKANPTRGSTGTTGVGSGIHMCMLYFQNATGTQFPMVPYRGAAPIMQDLISNQIDLSCPEAGQTLPQYRAGSIKAFGVLTKKRWFAAPEVPTLDESGFPGVVMPFWHALWAPKGLPKDVTEKLVAAVKESLASPEVRKRFMDLGHEVAPVEQQSPEGLYAVHKAEIEKWWPIIKAANIKLQ